MKHQEIDKPPHGMIWCNTSWGAGAAEGTPCEDCDGLGYLDPTDPKYHNDAFSRDNIRVNYQLRRCRASIMEDTECVQLDGHLGPHWAWTKSARVIWG